MFRREKKMKRFLRNFLLCACMMVLLSVCAFAAQVSVSDMKVKVNGVEQTPQAYLIDGNNYFKLRDLAMMLRETPSRFEVGYDSETKTVTMTPGKDYTPVGGELKRGEDQSASCTLSVCTLKIGDREYSCQSYNIGGNNYFKLRDLSSSISLSVGYDGSTRTVLLRSLLLRKVPGDYDINTMTNSEKKTLEDGKTKTIFRSNGKLAYYSIEEDMDDRQHRTTFYTADDRAYSVFTVQYNENDNLIKFVASLGNGMVVEYRLSFYDDQNRWIRDECYYGDGAMSSYSEAEYDENGLPWKERVYSVNDKNEVHLSTVNVFEFQNGALWKVSTYDAFNVLQSEKSFAGQSVHSYGRFKF